MKRLVVQFLIVMIVVILGMTTLVVLRRQDQFTCKSEDQEWCQFTNVIHQKQYDYFLPYGPGVSVSTDPSGIQSRIMTSTDGENVKIMSGDTQIVLFEDILYHKKGVEPWASRKATAKSKEYFLNVNDQIRMRDLLSADTPQKVGTEACEGRMCFVYDTGMLTENGENFSVTVSFDTSEYLLRRVKVKYHDGSTIEVWPSYLTSAPIIAPI